MSTAVATRREVEVDTALADLYERFMRVRGELDSAKLSLAHKLGIRPVYETRTRRVVRETAEELLALAAERLAGEMMPWERNELESAAARWHEKVAERDAVRAAMTPLDEEYARTRWSRFFLVRNHGGHIHSSMSCSTCFPTTVFGWLPELSGLTERDAVEAHGPLLCSVCFPSAPVEWTVGLAKDESGKCEGSGEYVANPNRRRYLACGTCGEFVSVTSTGKLRAHKRKEA